MADRKAGEKNEQQADDARRSQISIAPLSEWRQCRIDIITDLDDQRILRHRPITEIARDAKRAPRREIASYRRLRQHFAEQVAAVQFYADFGYLPAGTRPDNPVGANHPDQLPRLQLHVVIEPTEIAGINRHHDHALPAVEPSKLSAERNNRRAGDTP